MAKRWTPTPNLAGFLSALLPGLGQFCCRRWGRGFAFLASTSGIDLGLDVTGSLWSFIRTRTFPHSSEQVVIGFLLITIVALWSILDARRVATALVSASSPAR